MTKLQTFRIAIHEDLHQRIKIEAINRRMQQDNRYSSISSIVESAITSWVVVGQPQPQQAPLREGAKGIQTTFKLANPQVTDVYKNTILKRLNSNPTRRAGARLDRHETDNILYWWLGEIDNEAE